MLTPGERAYALAKKYKIKTAFAPGKLGVDEKRALADLLLVDGNPLENVDLIAGPAKNFIVIMKNLKIYKNSL
jgi:imidazolonepropionase-like amidohydrolase